MARLLIGLGLVVVFALTQTAFTRRLQAYEKILNTGTTLVLSPDSALLRYLQNPKVQ